MTDVTLSILIPVYNGGKYLHHLLGLFADHYEAKPQDFEGVEIVIANNASEDTTQTIAESFRGLLPMLAVHLLAAHVPTAEENVFRAFSYCKGRFTWALGVDDIPNFECFARVMERLRIDEYDFYLFNFSVVSEKMIVRRKSNFFLYRDAFALNIVDIAQRLGFWFVLAGISGQIVRTECVKGYDMKALIAATSPIYAHVTAYLECFKARRSAVVNESLVFYKVKQSDIVHWQCVARKLCVFDEYFWTLGYIRQLEYLEAGGIIDGNYLRYMLETNEDGFFRPVYVIAEKLATQVQHFAGAKEKRNKITRQDYYAVRDYLIRKDPFLREFLWRLDELFERVTEQKRVTKWDWYRANKLLNHYRAGYIFSSLSVGGWGKYEIFRLASRYFAAEPFSRDLLLEFPRFLDKQDMMPVIFSGLTLDEVKQKIATYEKDAGLVRTLQGEEKLTAEDAERTHYQLAVAYREWEKLRASYDKMHKSFLWKISMPLRLAIKIARRLVRM